MGKLHALYFLKNISKNYKIALLEKNEILTDDVKIAHTFNSFFKGVINTSSIEKDKSIQCGTRNETDQVKIAIKKYKENASVLNIKQLIKDQTEFYFALVILLNEDLTAKEIQNFSRKLS